MPKFLSSLIKWLVALGTIEVLLRLLNAPSYLAPTPSSIVLAIAPQWQGALKAWSVTALEASIGLTMAVTISFGLALLTAIMPSVVSRFINNAGVVVQSTPLLAIAPLLSLWLGQSFAAKATAACLASLFPLLTGWLAGFRAVDPDHEQFFENLEATKWQRIRHLLIPIALPYFFGGLRVAVPLALLGAIVGEFIGSSEGLGFRLLSNSYYVRTPLMFGYIAIAAFTGWAATAILGTLERRALFWHGAQRSNRS